jgi:hypothetical protein
VTDNRIEGGEGACYAHLICPECGAVLDDVGHRDGCIRMESESRIELTHDVDPVPGD